MAKHRRKREVTRGQVKAALIAIVVLLVVAIILLTVALTDGRKAENDPPKATTTITTTNTTNDIGTTSTTTVATTTTATTVITTTTGATQTVKTTVDPINHYVQPANAVWYLKLANDWNTLPENYDSSFTAVEYGEGLSGKLFDSRAVEALREMLKAGNTEDPSLRLQPVSCYRSVALQKSLYERQVNVQLGKGMSRAEAEIVAATIVKRPGQSEHNTGLAVDLGGSGNYSLEQSFENTAAFKWLYAHCAEYGFVLRFPKDKEAITGVIYEPWHYRYVGKEAAKEIMESGICLEEYLEKYQK